MMSDHRLPENEEMQQQQQQQHHLHIPRPRQQQQQKQQQDTAQDVPVADCETGCSINKITVPSLSSDQHQYYCRPHGWKRILIHYAVTLTSLIMMASSPGTTTAANVTTATIDNDDNNTTSNEQQIDDDELVDDDNRLAKNPYVDGGCLYQLKPNWTKKRICTSEDTSDHINKGYCQPDDSFQYPEIRIASQNWESAFFETWILQVVLSEILGVPTSVESGLPDVKVRVILTEEKSMAVQKQHKLLRKETRLFNLR
jgi:hypothetical protein